MILARAVIGPLRCARRRSRQRAGEERHDLVDLFLGHDKRRRQHRQVAVDAVGVARRWARRQARPRGRAGGERLGETRRPAESGSRVDVSATNSIPASSPRPRTSPTQRKRAERLQRAMKHPPIAARSARSAAMLAQIPERGDSRRAQTGVMGERLRVKQRPRAAGQDIRRSGAAPRPRRAARSPPAIPLPSVMMSGTTP